MKYTLVNKNYREDYVKNLVNERGGDYNKLIHANKNDIAPPNLLDNIEEGAALFKQNVLWKDDKKIVLIRDCDVDGETSSAIIYQYIKHLNSEKEVIAIGHSGKQHGLEDMTERILEMKDVSLVICPDAGSSDYQYHKQLKESGIDTLCLDHHLADKYSEDAIVINNQLSLQYKNKDLTGAGVAYQFCRFLDEQLESCFSDELVDLAALGIISDMGSVLSLENMAIITLGLNKTNKNPLFQALLDKQDYSMGGVISPMTVAFYITPLINGLIRVGSYEEKEKLFQALIDGDKIVPSTKRGDKGNTEILSCQVARDCTNARARQNRIKDRALEDIEMRIEKDGLASNKILTIVLDDERDNFPPELNGLVAMQCASKYKKPTMVLRENDEGYLRGSIRGLSNSELKSFKDYLESTKLCEYVQGHNNAAGCSLKASNLEKLHELANKQLSEYDFENDSYEVNFVREANSTDLSDIIKDIDNNKELFGQGNPTPLLAVNDICVPRANIQVIGKNKDTIKFEKNNIVYMIFKASQETLQRFTEWVMVEKEEVNLCIVGEANENFFNGKETSQIFIKDFNIEDIRFSF